MPPHGLILFPHYSHKNGLFFMQFPTYTLKMVDYNYLAFNVKRIGHHVHIHTSHITQFFQTFTLCFIDVYDVCQYK